MNKHITSIQRSSRLGLWTSVAIVIATSLFVWLCPWQFRQNPTVNTGILVAGSILAVGSISMALLVIRRNIPRLRQAEALETKLQGYASHVRHLYSSLSIVILILCLMTVLTAQSALLMLSIVTTMMLFLAYPNIYKLKTDLGLTPQEMRNLFGDRYIDNDSN